MITPGPLSSNSVRLSATPYYYHVGILRLMTKLSHLNYRLFLPLLIENTHLHLTVNTPFPTQAKVSSFEFRIKNGEIFDRNLADYTHYSIEDDIPGFASAVIIIEHNSLCEKDLDYESCLGEAIGE